MSQIINSASGVADHGQGPFQREHEAPPPPSEAAPAPPDKAVDAADVGLMIEDDETAGGSVYTTVDRRTGAVIRQLPRDSLLKLSEAPDYAAGALIKTRA
jgi:hypothetical protein